MPSIWSPLPPSRSGIANYAAMIYDDEEDFGDVRFVVSEAAEMAHPRAVAAHDAADDGRTLLQVGNNRYHDYIYEKAQDGGAVVELHDVSLHHLVTELTLGRKDFAGYREVMESCEGEWGRRFAFQRAKGYYTPSLEFHTRVNRTVCDRAAAVIVHSQWAKQQLEMQGCAAPVYAVPHFALSPEEAGGRARTRAEARRLLNIPDDAFVVLAAGYVTRAKKVEWVVKAFEALADEAPRAMLIIAGECGWPAVSEAIEASPFRERIRMTGYLPDAAFCDHTLAADLVPVMRFPSAGESSGVAARAMGFGRLVIAPELMAFSDLDNRHCEKIDLDRDPVEQLVAIFKINEADEPSLRRRETDIAEHAAAHFSRAALRKDLAEIVRWHWS